MMRSHLFGSFLLGAAALAASPAQGEDIPVEIHWQGVQPSSVSRGGADGLRPLTYDAQAAVYRGQFTIEGNAPQRRTIIVSYGNFNHPLDVRIHRLLPGVRFTISYRQQPSCTDIRVSGVATRSNNLADAINRSVGAGQLLSIDSPNDCDQDLHLRAAQARYHQNVRMSELSQGLFLVNAQISEDYRELAERRGSSVADELAAYALAEQRLEAVQLVAARTDAQEERDFARAVDLNDLLTERIRSDPTIRETFRAEGVTELQLRRDATYLRDMAVTTSLDPG